MLERDLEPSEGFLSPERLRTTNLTLKLAFVSLLLSLIGEGEVLDSGRDV